MQPRTKRQKEILEYISSFIETRGYKPSYQQIALHFKLASKAAVAKHISALEKQGLISRRRENGSFSLQLYPQQPVSTDLASSIDWLDLPESVSSTNELADEPLLVPSVLLGFHRPEKLRAFRVANDSMIDDHICEGDVVIIEEKEFPRDGDLVVAVIDNQRAIFGRIYRAGANVEFVHSNPNFETAVIDADEVDVKGVYRGLFRPLI